MTSVFRAITERFQGKADGHIALRHSVSSTSLSMGRRYSVTGRSAQIVHAEQAVNEEYYDAMMETVCLNEQKLGSLKEAAKELAKQNIALRAEVIELSVALEGTWLQRGDRVAAAIADLFQKFQGLHQNLQGKYVKACETDKIVKKCVIKNEKPPYAPDYDYTALKQQLGESYDFLWGQSIGIIQWYRQYNFLYPEHRFLIGLGQLHQALSKDAFPPMIKQKIQTIKDEILSPENPLQESAQSLAIRPSAESSATIPSQLTHACDRSIYKTLQNQTIAQKILEYDNLQLQEENGRLQQKKEDLKNIEPQFADHFPDLNRSSLSDFHSSTEKMIKWHEDMKPFYPNLEQETEKLLAYCPSSFATGLYTTRLELSKLIPALQEMDLLVDQIKQDCPSPQSTT